MTFPCPICKGKGSWKTPILDDGSGPTEECGYCDGDGSIEIGGKRHKEIVALKIAEEIIKFVKPKQEEWSLDEMYQLGFKALDLIK